MTPLTALQAIQRYGRTLGNVLVIDVGYNDSSATYRQQLGQVVRAAKNRGVKGIVWVNLRVVPEHPDYRQINAIIGEEAGRRPILYVANWNGHARTKPASFGSGRDGIHLTSTGAMGLVRFVRRHIALAAQGPRTLAARPDSRAPDPVVPPVAPRRPPRGRGRRPDRGQPTGRAQPRRPGRRLHRDERVSPLRRRRRADALPRFVTVKRRGAS